MGREHHTPLLPRFVTHSIFLPKVDHSPSVSLHNDTPYIEQYDQSYHIREKEENKTEKRWGEKCGGIPQPCVVLLVTAREKKNNQN